MFGSDKLYVSASGALMMLSVLSSLRVYGLHLFLMPWSFRQKPYRSVRAGGGDFIDGWLGI